MGKRVSPPHGSATEDERASFRAPRLLCLYFMGLNLSNRQIAQDLSLNENDVQEMTTQLREGLAAKTPPVVLSGEVEIDEVYVAAGHKGNPAAVEKKAARADATD